MQYIYDAIMFSVSYTLQFTPRSLEIRLVTPSKVNIFFDLPQDSMNIATILGDDVTVGVSYLEVIGLM
jgi:hypothetical protein